MADYYQLKNQNIFNPPANTSLGNTSNQFGNAFVQNDLVLGNVTVTGATIVTPKVSTIGYPGDDTAADPAGGQTITLTGSGFLVGASVLINGSAVGVVSVVSSTTITFTSPANSAGSYVLYVINTDGGTAIAIPGIQYSGVPTWTTAAGSLGSVYETESFNQSVTATGDAPITYSLFSGSIPPGATFNSNGTITGTSQVLSSSTTYTFTVRATDAEAQDTDRSFSLTINPDVVTWSSPANGTTYTSALNSAISNVTLVATSAVGSGITYTANALPVGLSLTGANISGTPTVEANSSSLLTATANTTSESSSITINWAINVANDAYFEYNTLLIPGASTTFVDDASTNNFAVTIFGDTKPNSFNPYTPGYYSVYSNNTGVLSSGTTATIAAGVFTFEGWFYLNAVTSQTWLMGLGTNTGGSTPYFDVSLTSSGTNIAVSLTSTVTGVFTFNATYTWPLNRWVHLAAVGNGTTVKVYVNGVGLTTTLGSGTFPGSYLNTLSLYPWVVGLLFGGGGARSDGVNGYVSNFRFVNGTAVYTADFTPSTTPLTAISGTAMLACQSNRLINSNNVSLTTAGVLTINSFQPFVPNNSYSTYGSGYFDGTGDYLLVPYNTNINITTGNFTIEAWCYPTTTTNGVDSLWGYGVYGTMVYHAGTTWYWEVGDGGGNYFTITGTAPLNAWNHIACTRSGSTFTLWINGVSAGTNTTAGALASSRALNIGENITGGTQLFTGYINDFRLVKGTAVYTTTFTPPSAPLTAIANTSLLTLQNNQSVNNSVFLDNSTNNFLVTRNGNTTQGTFSPYGGNWSNYYGTTAMGWQTPAASATNIIGTATLTSASTFTVEAWIYQLTRHSGGGAGLGYVFGSMNISGGQADWTIGPNSAGNLTVFWYNSGNNVCNSTNTIPLNTWTHIAVSINAGAISMYINGVKETLTGTTTATTTSGSPLGYLASGGYTYGGSTWQGFNGYISNLRVVKSALYSVTFTPSTTPLTAISGTSLLTCQSNRFIDNSINSYTLTITNALTVQRFSPFNPSSLTPTSYSGYFDGTGDYLSAPSNSAFAFGTGNFTLECWIYVSSPSDTPIYEGRVDGNSTLGFTLTAFSSTVIRIFCGSVLISATVANYTNQWTHVAVVKNSGTTTLYVNGVSGGTTASLGNLTDTQPLIGAGRYTSSSSPSAYMNGYVSNFRIVKGTAVYTGAFTPSTTPLTAISGTSLLTLQSTTFIDNSTNNFTITAVGNSQPTQQNPFGFTSATTEGYTVSTIGGSGYFDGSGDYLTVPRSTLCIPGASQNFTIEAWVYSERAAGVTAQQIMGFHASGTSSDWILYISGSNYPIFYIDAIGTSITSSIIVNPYSWNHVAVVRKDTNTITLYVNGVAGGTATSTSTLTGSGANPLSIGSDYNGVNYVTKGYISNGRIVNGTALYTSNFVPPSAPLTAVQNTSLLTNMTSAGIYDAAMMTTMETVADAKLSTAVSKFGGSSVSFDGTGDYLSTYDPSYSLSVGSGDFTYECWLYVNSLPGTVTAVYHLKNDAALATTVFVLELTTNGAISISTGTSLVANGTSGKVTTGSWIHFAFVRTSGVFKTFFNGIQDISTANTTTYNGTYLQIGAWRYSGYDNSLNGYLDDIRITKGYARYTSNFTPATSAFPIF